MQEPGNREPAGLRIDAVTPQDLDAVLQIERLAFSAPWTKKMFAAELEGNPFSTLLAARSVGAPDGRATLVGYICFWVVFEELRLMTLAVHPSMRRRGIARALVRQALEAGRARGASRAVLEVRASNEAARRLYEAEGFRRFAVRAQYYRDPVEDALLMSLDSLDRAFGEIGACCGEPGGW